MVLKPCDANRGDCEPKAAPEAKSAPSSAYRAGSIRRISNSEDEVSPHSMLLEPLARLNAVSCCRVVLLDLGQKLSRRGMMIEAVIWDFGGVITTSPFEAFARFEKEHGLPIDTIRRTNAANH
jgi:hypothetical protein